MTPRQVVEFFHLVFARALFAGLADKRLLVIKGGINLRFFFKSVRFSEDLDVDVVTMSKQALENRVDRLLKSTPVVGSLRARGIDVQDVTKPKQTETVQKWKLALTRPSTTVAERTKIEFSRRPTLEESSFDPVDAEIVKRYSMPTFFATRYRCREAVRQKIHALYDRTETQPRDVFDLNLLFARADAPTDLDDEAVGWIDDAVAKVMSLTYDQYLALVVAYLDPEYAELYSSQQTWEAMQLDVVTRMEALR